MDESWFSEYAEELGRCVADALRSAETCEQLLESLDAETDPGLRSTVGRAVIAPTAVSRVLVDLIDRHPALVLGVVRLCADTSLDAVELLEQLRDGRTVDAASALRACAASCAALIEAI